MASLLTQMVKNLPARQEPWVWSLGWEDPLEKGMAAHSSILAWRIPWTDEPVVLQSMGSQRVGHDWATKCTTNTHIHISVDGHSGWLHVLAIVDIIAVNIGMHISFQISVLGFFVCFFFFFFWHITRSEIAMSYGSSIFGLSRNVHIVFYSDCISLHSHQRSERKVKSLRHVWLFETPWSLLGSSVYGIFQARILEWVSISFSRIPSQPRDWTRVSPPE